MNHLHIIVLYVKIIARAATFKYSKYVTCKYSHVAIFIYQKGQFYICFISANGIFKYLHCGRAVNLYVGQRIGAEQFWVGKNLSN